MRLTVLTLLFIFCKGVLCMNRTIYKFDKSFSFGVATSAYQIEGAWNVSGKGFNYWDYLTHKTKIVEDGSTGDVACNSYYKMEEDIKLLKFLGVQQYRFSIAWSRILPTGLANNINGDGVAYYKKLIDRLLEENIEPMVTIYHFDHTYGIHLLGSWFQPKIADYLAEYADILFNLYGEKVKTWITINEPYSMCVSWVAALQPYVLNGTAEYICGQNILRAHAAIYNVYKKKYKSWQNGKLSMAFNLQGHLPATEDIKDIEAVERVFQFEFGWFVHPLVYGNYPPVMIDIIDRYSKAQGFSSSRLPKFSNSELRSLKGTLDFIGLNNYDTFLVCSDNSTIDKSPSYVNDYGAKVITDPGWNTSYSIQMKASGFGNILRWIKKTYGDPEICITEQGIPDYTGTLNDNDRHKFLLASISQLLKSIHEDDVNVTSYFFWSFMDNFEWQRGYTTKYGLIHVDFNDPDRSRTPKVSARTFSRIVRNRSLRGLK